MGKMITAAMRFAQEQNSVLKMNISRRYSEKIMRGKKFIDIKSERHQSS